MNESLSRPDGTVIAPVAILEFSWGAALAGTFAAITTIFFLLFLGAGVGLSSFSVADTTSTSDASSSAVTYGAVYFLFSLVVGAAIGGYLAGRLMRPAFEPQNEGPFRASAHGLVSWTVAVVATATIMMISGLSLAGSSISAAGNAAGTVGLAAAANSETDTSFDVVGYWLDTLMRQNPTTSTTAGGGTSPTTSPQTTAQTTAAPNAAGTTAVPDSTIPPGTQTTQSVSPGPQNTPTASSASSAAGPRGTRVDPEGRAEAGRLLAMSVTRGMPLSAADHDRLVSLVSQMTGMDPATASQRVDDTVARMRQEMTDAAETARKAGRSASFWMAAALLIGAVAAIAGAVNGRTIDNRARRAFFRR